MEKKTSNFSPGGRPILTEQFHDAFEIFLNLVPIQRLSKATIKLLLFYLALEDDVEDYVLDYFEDVAALLNFFDALEEIYDQSELFTSPKKTK